MTRVDFYFNAESKLEAARKLASKAYQAGLNALLYVADDKTARALDEAIWSHDKLGFLPHVHCSHPLAGQTPVLIGTDADVMTRHDVVINLEADYPSCFSRFERLLEVVGKNEADRQSARLRYRFYKELGYPIKDIDLARHG